MKLATSMGRGKIPTNKNKNKNKNWATPMWNVQFHFSASGMENIVYCLIVFIQCDTELLLLLHY